MRLLTQTLARWLELGGEEVGEIYIRSANGGFVLCHRADRDLPQLTELRGAPAARALANFDDHGGYRPLKTAPNLRHGWRLFLETIDELHSALDYFYPAMLGIWRSHSQGALAPVPLRETLGRQSGMYAVTRKITDAQANAMIGEFCRTDGGCLKRILWPLAPDFPITSLPSAKFDSSAPACEMPLLCHEACNLLVARAREVVKKGEYIA